MKEIFVSVMDRSAEERQSALAEACQGDPELQAELSEFLAQFDQVGAFLNGAPPVSASSLLVPGHLVANRYEVIRLLGTGGMGEVYEVHDSELGARVALKVIHPEMSFNPAAMDRFRREVQLARQVTHLNVCRVFDIGRDQQQAREIIFLTMELIEGETLAARLKRLGRIETQEALNIAVQLCHALGAAHQAGILHRDFKSSNVMLIGSGEKVRAVVTDFGIARWMQDTGDSTALTTKGAIFGTPAYMSPEQIQGKELTPASDIYSLGVVLYEMVVGARPFQDESSWVEAMKRLTEDPVPLRKLVPDLAQNWNDTILTCLQRHPAGRFTSTEQVLAGLQQSKKLTLRLPLKKLLLVAAALLVVAVLEVTLHDWLFPPQLPAEKRVAVLPFTLADNDSTTRAEVDGMAASLTINLAYLEASNSSLWLVPWKSIQQRPRNDEQHAAVSLGANLLVTGEFEKTGKQLLMHLRIKDASTLKKLRSQVIQIPEDKITRLQDELLEKVSAMLQVQVPEEMRHLLAKDQSTEPAAYHFYYQGLGYLSHYDAENIQRAIDSFRRALEINPKFARAYADLAFAYAWTYRDTKNPTWLEKAKQASDRALTLNDNLASVHLARAMILEDRGNLQGAIEEYQKAREQEPFNNDVLNRLAGAYDRNGRVLDAYALLYEAVKDNPSDWLSHDFLGVFDFDHANYEWAEKQFKSAKDLAPYNPIAYYNLGGVYVRQQRYKDAEDILHKCIAVLPTDACYENLGTVLSIQGKNEDSIPYLEQAATLASSNSDYWFNLGNAYVRTNNPDQSRQEYQRAVQSAEENLKIDPNNDKLLVSLALYYAVLEDKTNAYRILARLADPFTRGPEMEYQLAETYERIGERRQALKAIKSALLAGFPLATIEGTEMFDRLRADPQYRRMIAP